MLEACWPFSPILDCLCSVGLEAGLTHATADCIVWGTHNSNYDWAGLGPMGSLKVDLSDESIGALLQVCVVQGRREAG